MVPKLQRILMGKIPRGQRKSTRIYKTEAEEFEHRINELRSHGFHQAADRLARQQIAHGNILRRRSIDHTGRK